MDASHLRRKDTTKGPPLRILCLDGGGVRGYSMLIILQELMHRTFVEMEGRAPKRNEIPKPCDHFDLIVGTGTGGLIALMLGRLRLSIETCKDVYVRMTKRVFETDKTIAGIPYRSTLFKASKLEEAIRECVREHTVFDDEGNDQGDGPYHEPDSPTTPTGTGMTPGSALGRPSRSMSVASRYSQIGTTPISDFRGPLAASRWGKPNASLYDSRENRTKTAITAVYRGSRRGAPPVLLRSYDSRKETAPEEKCTIWQAGRATCATQLAFKPIQIGQSVFLDEGGGRYNPAPTALDEAVLNEWPGREVGVFISVGTGKRPPGTNNQQHLWWEGFVSGGIGDFAEARRRLIAKIEGCEDTHQDMLMGRLADRGVDVDNYYRLNVEIGVGEFGMNEWNRLSEISTSTRMYLSQSDVQSKNISSASKLARIWQHNIRYNRAIASGQIPDPTFPRHSWEYQSQEEPEPPSIPGAVELPAADVTGSTPPRTHRHSQRSNHSRPQSDYQHQQSDDDKFLVHADEPYTYEPRLSSEATLNHHRHNNSDLAQGPIISITPPPPRPSIAPPPPPPQRQSNETLNNGRPSGPPPLPPKTPLTEHARPVQGMTATMTRPPAGVVLPYPDTDGPPPVVNLARKPEFGVR